MSQWQSAVYKHGAHLVGIMNGTPLPAKVYGSGFTDRVRATPPLPVWCGHPNIRRMANAPYSAFWVSNAMRASSTTRAYFRQSISRYPYGNPFPGPSNARSISIYITGSYSVVYASMGWAAIGRAHHKPGSPTQIWANVQYFNSGGGLLRTDDLGLIENAGEGTIGYSGTYAKTLIYNRPFYPPGGTDRINFNYTIHGGGYEAHDSGDRSPGYWNPDVDISASGQALGMLMSDYTEEWRNDIK